MKVALSSDISVELLPERALLWEKTLVVADLHWGKAEAFQQHGIPIPSSLLAKELDRLLDLARRKNAARVIVLGDLIHSPEALGEEVLEKTRDFFRRRTFEMILVEGNHDRRLKVPADWNLEVLREPFCERGLAFCHHQDVPLPPGKEDHYSWSGHLHPTVLLGGGKDLLRLPCFIVGKTQGVVPAFSDFTRGVSHSVGAPENRDRRFFSIAEGEVIALNLATSGIC
jgi:DNA ligase-associated metallophosphoesterase